MGKLLALDLGTKTLGVALTDREQKFIFGRPTICFPAGEEKKALKELLSLIELEKPEVVIFGLPLHIDGHEGDRVKSVYQFSEELKKACPNLEIAYIDERLTTLEAKARMEEEMIPKSKHKALIDQYAAKIILENYLLRVKEAQHDKHQS